MKRALIYIRVSTAEQVANYSLETQLSACQDFCSREGLEVDRVFREEGESAKTAARPQLQTMLNYCAINAKKREIGAVVVYRLDRLARMSYDHGGIRLSLKKVGVQIRAVLEHFDDSPGGRFYENMVAAAAQFDNDVRSARTVEGMRQGLLQGRWMWQAPLGYLKPTSATTAPSLVFDPEVAPLVRLAFEEAAKGTRSKGLILEELTALGLQTRHGKSLTPQTFGRLLRNPIYAGRVVNARWDIDAPGDFEPIVGESLFRAVQGVEGRPQNGTDQRLRDHPDFPLRRFIRCADCGAPLTASWSKGRSGRYGYYRCPRKDCRGVNVRKERLEQLFVERLETLCVRPQLFGLLGAVVRDEWGDRTGAARAAQERVDSRLTDLERRRDRLVDAFVHDRAIDRETYEQQRRRLDEQVADLRDLRLASKVPSVNLDRALLVAEKLVTDLPGCWNRLQWQQRPQFLRVVYPGGVTFGNGLIGTGQSSWLFNCFGVETVPDDAWAPPTGFEPVPPP